MSSKTLMRLRFIRRVQFSRFTMEKGEIWDCYEEHGTGKSYLEAVASNSDRFDFSSCGPCLVRDVENIK